MKKVAQLALQRGARFVLLFEHELEVLDTLPLWHERLFRVLVQSSSYATGLGSTTYAQLLERLRPLQPRSGRRHYVPDEWAIWRGLVAFEKAHIVWRNTGWSQQAGALFFELAPRGAKIRPTSKSAPPIRTPPDSLQSEQRRGL